MEMLSWRNPALAGRKFMAFLSVLLLWSAVAGATRTPEIEWTKTYGGSENDIGYSVQQTRDGGYIIAGETSTDIWLIKTDASGDKVWDKKFSLEYGYDCAYSVQETKGSGYVIAGHASHSTISPQWDVWLIKTDANGNKVWDKAFDGAKRLADGGHSAQQTKDNGYIITGYTKSYAGDRDVWLIKTDAMGNKEWDKKFGEKNLADDEGFSVQQTKDSGYIITGATSSHDRNKSCIPWLIKTDANGNESWGNTFGKEGSCDYAKSVVENKNGEYVVVGYTRSSGAGGYDILLVKIDTKGKGIWYKTFGGSEDDYGYSVQQTKDGGYILVGSTESYGAGEEDVWVIKTDADGKKEWDKIIGGSERDRGYSVQQTSDGSYIITGCTWTDEGKYDLLLIKIGAEAR